MSHKFNRAPDGAPSADLTALRIRTFLERERISQRKAAEECGIPYQTFNGYCTGKARPSESAMFKLMKIGISSFYLFDGAFDLDEDGEKKPRKLTRDEEYIAKYLMLSEEDAAAVRDLIDIFSR